MSFITRGDIYSAMNLCSCAIAVPTERGEFKRIRLAVFALLLQLVLEKNVKLLLGVQFTGFWSLGLRQGLANVSR